MANTDQVENSPCHGDDNNDDNNEIENKIKELIAGNGVFTAKFLCESAKNNPGKSLVGSPFSVVLLLAQLALFASGEALEQLYALLNLKTLQQISGSVPLMLTSLNGEQNITLTIAENVFGNKDYPLSKKFIEISRRVFEAEAQNLDYSNTQEAAKIINNWIASKTNNLIQNLVPADALGPDTRLVLTNAIYFKANWLKPFEKENTKPKPFHVSSSDTATVRMMNEAWYNKFLQGNWSKLFKKRNTCSKTITVQMMNQVGKFKYGVMPKSKAQVIELPYVNENIVFLVLLPPNTAQGMNNLLKEQLNFTSITSIRSNLRITKVNLSLPKFETETSTDLQDILEKVNVTKIFNPQGSGLQGMLEKPEDVYVSRFLQKAKILVFEEGAEAAASNALISVASLRKIEKPVEYNADRSFIYYLWHKDSPLFCGLYNGSE